MAECYLSVNALLLLQLETASAAFSLGVCRLNLNANEVMVLLCCASESNFTRKLEHFLLTFLFTSLLFTLLVLA